MPDRAAILAANRAFYQAIASGDAAAMDQVWARDSTVSCLHPDWLPLVGREAVLQSWRDCQGGSPPIPVSCRDEQVVVHGPVGMVVCLELVGDLCLAATNLFLRDADGVWRLVHHQGGLVDQAAVAAKPFLCSALRKPQSLH